MTIRHRVQLGDRLSSIAATYGVPPAAVLAANPRRERATLPSGVQVFASLASGEEIAVPGPGDLGWPWSECPPSGGTKNPIGPGCTPTSSDPNTEDPLGRWYLLGGRIGIDAEERDTFVNGVPTRAWVCAKPCWTGDTCDCQAVGICDGGACGAVTATPGGGSDPITPPDSGQSGSGGTNTPPTPPTATQPPPPPDSLNALAPQPGDGLVTTGTCSFLGMKGLACSTVPWLALGTAVAAVAAISGGLYIATRKGGTT